MIVMIAKTENLQPQGDDSRTERTDEVAARLLFEDWFTTEAHFEHSGAAF